MDEKKCLSMKATIEHIQMKLCEALGVNLGTQFYKTNGDDLPAHIQDESGDEVLLKIPHSDSDDSDGGRPPI
jgi:hypothetical protein